METSHPSPSAARLRPPRPARGVIARPRLDGLLDLVRSRTLTVVKAPPGYGKTTVAQSWADALAAAGARVAWLSLHADDDGCERFFAALVAALRHGRHARADAAVAAEGGNGAGTGVAPAACPPNGTDSAGWGSRELSIPLAHRLDWLMDELAADPAELYIVLDDYHELTQPEIHRALAGQLQRAGDHLHLLVLTRSAPPIDLATLRAHDAVLEIDGPTLCFDFAETQALLAKGQPAAPEPHDTAALHALTGGWVAALRAAMLSARIQQGAQAPAPRRLPPTLRSINALFAELMDRLPAELRGFLEAVSVAERLCAPLAERLSGQGGGTQQLLQRLERQQFFINPLDDRQQWFAFHPLFRDFLLRSAQQRDAAAVRAAREAAARWYAEQGHWTDAIAQALAAGDTALALGYVERHAMNVVGAGDLTTLLAWERQLRAHLVESPLRLRLAFAWGLGLAMACDKALVLLDGVEAQLPPEPAGAPQSALRCECLALRAVLVCTTGDHELAAALAAQCNPAAPRPQWVESALRNVAAATSLHTGRWGDLFTAVHGATAAAAGTAGAGDGDTTAVVYRLSIRGLAELRQGHLDDAAALLQQAMDAGAGSKPLAALPAPTLALLRYLQDQPAVAARINAEHFEVNKRVAPIEALYASYLVAARVARLDGQALRARQLLDEGASIAAARRWRRAEIVLLLEKARLCLLDGRVAEARAGAGEMEAMAMAKSRLDRQDFGRLLALARAWCDLVDHRPARAVEALQPLLAEARREGRVIDAIVLAGSLALAHRADGDIAAAAAALRIGAKTARDSGAVRALVDQPAPLAPLCAAVLQLRGDQALPPALAAWVTALQRSPGAGGGAAAPRGARATLESLSPREHRILGLLSDGQSNKQIARGLGIAPETVKTHVSKIFTKLGAQNRAQAAAMLGTTDVGG